MHYRSVSWLLVACIATDTSINSGGIKLVEWAKTSTLNILSLVAKRFLKSINTCHKFENTVYSEIRLIRHTKGPVKCVRLYRMSENLCFIFVSRNTLGPNIFIECHRTSENKLHFTSIRTLIWPPYVYEPWYDPHMLCCQQHLPSQTWYSLLTIQLLLSFQPLCTFHRNVYTSMGLKQKYRLVC